VGCQNSVRVPRKRGFADGTPVLNPQRPARKKQLPSADDRVRIVRNGKLVSDRCTGGSWPSR
jgi:hypothetical protein